MRLKPTLHVVSSLKPYSIPDGFVLCIDTREQRPLFTSPPETLTVERKALPSGDYSVKGFERRFCIERKQISDLYSYIGKERRRTTQKMQLFACMDWVGLVIEATEAEILAGYYQSSLTPEVARQALVSFEVRSRVHVYYNPNRTELERYILDRALKYYRIQREVK